MNVIQIFWYVIVTEIISTVLFFIIYLSISILYTLFVVYKKGKVTHVSELLLNVYCGIAFIVATFLSFYIVINDLYG